MRPSARERANRRNAKASTGPRTAAGKASVAKNALRHGLGVPALRDPVLSEEIDRLARLIAGERADPARLEGARQIAEAQIDLRRVRRARCALLADPQARVKKLGAAEMSRAVRSLIAQAKAIGTVEAADLACDAMLRLTDTRVPDGVVAPALEEGFDALAPQLFRLDRYERRALSRRKSAIRDFDRMFTSARAG